VGTKFETFGIVFILVIGSELGIIVGFDEVDSMIVVFGKEHIFDLQVKSAQSLLELHGVPRPALQIPLLELRSETQT